MKFKFENQEEIDEADLPITYCGNCQAWTPCSYISDECSECTVCREIQDRIA